MNEYILIPYPMSLLTLALITNTLFLIITIIITITLFPGNKWRKLFGPTTFVIIVRIRIMYDE